MFRNIIIIGNPIAGGGAIKKIYKALDIFKKRGFNTDLLLTQNKGDAEILAKRNVNKQSTLIIAAGGDGTYNEVANGLINSDTPMAILPVGTTSVLAKELKMPSNISKAVDFIINGRIQPIHLGKIIFERNADFVSRFFILMAGIGFDGEAVFGVHKQIKKYFGKLGYISSGLNVLLKYNPKPIDIIAYDAEIIKKGYNIKFKKLEELTEHESYTLTGYSVVIGKAACYGGNFKFTPDARLTDPTFYMFVAHSRSRRSILKYFAGIAVNMHLRYNDISYLRTSKVKVLGDARVQIDGDYVGTTPISIEVAPNALNLVMSNY